MRLMSLFALCSLLIACSKSSTPSAGPPVVPPAVPGASPTTPTAEAGEPGARGAAPVERDEPGATPAGGEPTPTPADEEPADPMPSAEEAAAAPTEPGEAGGEEGNAQAAPTPEGTQVPGWSTEACGAVAARERSLIEASGTEEMRAAIAAESKAETLARCNTYGLPPGFAECVDAAETAVEIFRKCSPIAFQGRDIEVGRTFSASADNSGVEPSPLSQHGDSMSFGSCAMIRQDAGQFVGFFIQCNGKTHGPITTGDDIRESMAELSKSSAAGHSAVMGIISNYPRGGGPWRVCDGAGRCRIE